LNNNTKKQIDELADGLASWGVKRVSVELQQHNSNDDHLASLLIDPRERYYEERRETWTHDSNFKEGCNCSACTDIEGRIDPCVYGCHIECVPDCK
jgi:hypothetical protein